MKITLLLELYTELRISGPGSILMFKRTAEIELDAYKLARLLRSDGYIFEYNMRITPVNVKATDTETLTGYCKGNVHPTGGTLEYFKRLIKDGWVPNAKDSKAIRSKGYPEFFPEKFTES